MLPINELLCDLLNRLDDIAVEHREVEDTAVREAMAEAILNGFCRKQDDYRLPLKFAMYSENGNVDVIVALAIYENRVLSDYSVQGTSVSYATGSYYVLIKETGWAIKSVLWDKHPDGNGLVTTWTDKS